MTQVALKVRDLECPEWVDEWLWDRVMNELGDVVVAEVIGFSASVCFCCNELHRAPVVKQHEENMLRLFEALGVNADGDKVSREEPWAERQEAWQG